MRNFLLWKAGIFAASPDAFRDDGVGVVDEQLQDSESTGTLREKTLSSVGNWLVLCCSWADDAGAGDGTRNGH